MRTCNEEQIAYRNKLYDDAKDVLNRMLRVMEKVQAGEFEAAACRQENIDHIRFRSFIRSNWVCNEKEKKEFYDDCPYTWQEAFLEDVYGKNDISVVDFDKSYAYILSTLTERDRTIVRMRYEEEMSLEDIGEELNLSRERVRQLLYTIKRRLNHRNRKIRRIKH